MGTASSGCDTPPDALAYLIDGMPVTIRQLSSVDDQAVVALHAALDTHDSYLRFFAPRPKNLGRIAAKITSQDAEHCAIGAFIGPQLIGIANFVVLPDQLNTAEIALVVGHDQQLHGAGTVLLQHLRILARQCNVDRFVAEVLAENSRMLQVIADVGWPTTLLHVGGIVHVEMELDGTQRNGTQRNGAQSKGPQSE